MPDFPSDENQITYTHPEYRKAYPDLLFSKSCFEGKKAWFDDGLGILPRNQQTWDAQTLWRMLPRLQDEEEGEYRDRLLRSHWEGYYEATIKYLTGVLGEFALKPDTLSWKKTQERDEILNNIDMSGRSLPSFKAEADKMFLRDGWCLICVNYPPKPQEVVTTVQVAQLNLRPFLTLIERADVINIDVEVIDNANTLTRLVYCRRSYQPKGAFGKELIEQRVELLRDSTNIWQEIKGSGWQIVETYSNSLGYIPCVFYAVDGLDVFEICPPLLDLAEKNRKWYQFYSDYIESLHWITFPFLVRKGLIQTGDAREIAALPSITLSRHKVLDVPIDGDVKIVETSGSAVAANRQACLDIAVEILKRTVDFLQSVQMTATEAQMRAGQQKSTIESLIGQSESAWNSIFAIWADWEVQDNKDSGLTINRSFLGAVTPQLLSYFLELYDRNLLDVTSLWEIINSLSVLPEGMDAVQVLERLNLTPEVS